MPLGRTTTLCFPIRNNRILLGMKQRGVGAGKFNGFGGKVERGESVISAVARELHEECGLIANSAELCYAAELTFFTERTIDTVTHTFLLPNWTGEVVASAEMEPHWFALNAIPYDQMWADDRFWLPRVLAGERLRGTFLFSDSAELLHHHIETF